MISLVLIGAAGRMGRAVEQVASQSREFMIKGRVDRRGEWPAGADSAQWSEDPGRLLARGDVAIEFSSPTGARGAAAACAAASAALVSGSTGLTPGDEDAFRSASATIAVLRAANFSLGIAALRRAVAAALAALPPGWDVEIVERHHRRKQDSPSGTALTLARDVAQARGLTESSFRHGRQGRVGERPAAEIGLHAVRGGTWVGDHGVLMAGEGEWLELRHVAQDRAAFAQGALAAARFVASAPPGLYTLEDLLLTPGRHKS